MSSHMQVQKVKHPLGLASSTFRREAAGLGNAGPHVSGTREDKDDDWGSWCAVPPVLGSVDRRGRSFRMCWKVSRRPHSASPLRTQVPSQAGRTIWPSLGNAQWADRCQVMLCFHGRRFNAGFVSSCSRTRALDKHRAPWGPPFINRSWQGPCPGLPCRTTRPLSTSSSLLF